MSARDRAERVLAGTQTGSYTKRKMARDVIALSAALETILALYHGRAYHDADELALLPFQMKEVALIALAESVAA